MDGDSKGSEFRERGSIFKQMAEMKKKIQVIIINKYYRASYKK